MELHPTLNPISENTGLTNNNDATMTNLDDFLTLNISGRRYMTTAKTLSKIPGSRLSNLSPTDEAYVRSTDEYFFDRNPLLFDSILDAYRMGCLHIPPNICPFFVQQELEFWGIKDSAISPCCWPEYGTLLYERRKVESIARNLHQSLNWKVPDIETLGNGKRMRKWRHWRWKAWVFFEDPNSSKLAKTWAIFYLLVVLLSVALQCMMTHPQFRFTIDTHRRNITNETNPKLIMYATTDPYAVLEILDDICLGVFMLELILRLVACPGYLAFLTSIYNIIDIACVLPMLISMIVANVYPNFLEDEQLFAFVFFLAFLGVFRIFRLIKFARNFMGMRVMLLAMRASMKEILLLGMLISIGTLVFSTLVYYAEFYTEDEFLNIPIGFWWAIVTMTTVGYGDKKPKTGWGYVVGSLCALTGMLCTGLPIPIIANNFNLFYAHARGQRIVKSDNVTVPVDVDVDNNTPYKRKFSKSCLNIRVCHNDWHQQNSERTGETNLDTTTSKRNINGRVEKDQS